MVETAAAESLSGLVWLDKQDKDSLREGARRVKTCATRPGHRGTHWGTRGGHLNQGHAERRPLETGGAPQHTTANTRESLYLILFLPEVLMLLPRSRSALPSWLS